MKFKILNIALVSLLLCSCSGFLDEKNYSQRTDDDMFTSYEDADMFVMGLYATLSSGNLYRDKLQSLGTYGTDESLCYFVGSALNANFCRVSNFSHTTSDAYIESVYQGLYNTIMNANEAYWKIGKMNMNTTSKQKLQAEALFIRAFCYFNLVQFWGDVRLVTDFPDYDIVASRTATRASVEKVYGQIVEDIEFAKKHLPVKWASKYTARATKYAAWGVASKIYLTMASASKYGVAGYNFDPAEYYGLAKESADTVMTYGNYSLQSSYGDVFSSKNKYNKEIIFDITYALGQSTGNAFAKMGGPLSTGNIQYHNNGWAGRGYLRPSMYLAFCTYGHDNVAVGDAGWLTEFTSNDVRFWFNICTYHMDVTGEPKASLRGDISTWSAQKFSMRTVKFEGGYPWQNCPMNHPVLRYSDVLLIYAEAAGMLSLSDQSAYDAFNKVRIRARATGTVPSYLADFTTSSFSDTDKFMDEIMAERMREFCFEGVRRFDLLRTSRLFSTIDNMKTSLKAFGADFNPIFANALYDSDITNQKYNENVKSYHLLFPIPQYEMNIVTNPEYRQNPGWSSSTEYDSNL